MAGRPGEGGGAGDLPGGGQDVLGMSEWPSGVIVDPHTMEQVPLVTPDMETDEP